MRFRTAAVRVGLAAGLALAILLASFPQSAGPALGQSASQVTLMIDSPNPGITVANGQRVFIGGWAGASGAATSGVTSVEVFLDGGPGSGTSLGTARLGTSRPDVASVTRHPEWSNSGFNFDWTPRFVSEGQHTLYVVARSSGGDTATQTVQINGCGCGWNFQGTITNPAVRRIGTIGWELDTGGPGILIQRDIPLWPW
jgi:hypothetical protein